MIKVSLRPNLIYPFYLIMWTFLRKIVSIIISKVFKFKGSIIYTFLMFFGEISGGLFFYLNQKSYFKKKFSIKITSKFEHSFITNNALIKRIDSNIKILFLFVMTPFFDFFEFLVSTYEIGKIPKISGTLQIRLGGFLIIISSLVGYFTLKFPIFKHHIFSLIVMGISLLILIISEFLFQTFDLILTVKNLFLSILFSILCHLSMAFNNSIEKYIIHVNSISPYKLLFIQGIIGLIFIIIYSFFEDAISDLKKMYNNNSAGMFTLFLFLLLLYTIFGMLKNVYRMTTVMLFSPMNKHLAVIFINPIYIIYYFAAGGDFSNNNGKNYGYFFLNLILLIICDICGMIYNEFLVIYCCGLEYNTYDSVAIRASTLDELDTITDEEDDI